MSALPRDVIRLITLERYLELQLAEVRAALAAAQERDARDLASAQAAGGVRWRLEPMRDPNGGAPALLHRATCPLERGGIEASDGMASQVFDIPEITFCQVCDPEPDVPRRYPPRRLAAPQP
ncbi:hypothetical protein [Streptomyces sp. NPDC050738]|uniref:hypothetical protein n=1 Tax=Streptomyces sp. NPDC050738 TaxID=3154744 RepID=UPI003448E4BC